jgi:hypothetical protein
MIKNLLIIISFSFLNLGNLISTNYYVNDGFTTNDVYCIVSGTGYVGVNSPGRGLSPSTPVLSLTYLLAQYSASINSGDIIYIDAGTFSDAGINISKNGLNIFGAGTNLTFFNSNNASGYFMKILANNVLLKNLMIQEYGYSSGGTAQALFIGNGVTTYTGIVVQDVLFEKNGGSTGDMAVHVLANTSSSFIGGGGVCNTTTSNYSGVFHVIGNNINFLISNYVLTGNSGDCFGGSHGGAIRITGGSSTQKVEIKNSIFDKNENCVSTFNALDIYMETGDLKVYDSYFNNSRSAYAAGTAIGGSIEVLGGNAAFYRSKFTNHRSSGGMRGCAIGNAGGAVIIESCFFNGNSANKADDVHNSSGSISANNCIWNEIGQTGGTFTIANSGNPIVFEGTVVKTNTLAPTTFTSPSTPSYTGACTSSIIILPIELTRFEGDCNNGNVILNWQTASEKSNQEFNIERSIDGVNFEIIGSLKGAGNSSKILNYTFIDENKLEGLAYYRLSQTDYDGKRSQSNIIYVDNLCNQKLDSEISIYPNPALDNFTLELKLFQTAEVSFEIIDGIGCVIKTIGSLKYKMGLQSFNIDVNNWGSGVYFLKVLVDNKLTTHKLIKL